MRDRRDKYQVSRAKNVTQLRGPFGSAPRGTAVREDESHALGELFALPDGRHCLVIGLFEPVHDFARFPTRDVTRLARSEYAAEQTRTTQNSISVFLTGNALHPALVGANPQFSSSASPDFHEAMMTAVVNAYDNHMSMSEQVLKKDNVKLIFYSWRRELAATC